MREHIVAQVSIKLKRLLLIISMAICIYSCADERRLIDEIEAIPIAITMDRFDQAFARATPDNIDALKSAYPYLFPAQYDDEFWVKKLTDTIQLEINAAVEHTYPDSRFLNEEITTLFKHIKFYYPKTYIPEVVTITSEVDYRNRIILTDSLVLLGLDNYLGPEHHFYSEISKYTSKNFRKEQIVVEIAEAFAKTKIIPPGNFTFMEAMIYEGKQLYLMEQLLSLKPKHEILGYTPEEYQFAQDNESYVWEYFVGRELLYSTDRKLLNRFVQPAPFSKFYLELDNETPGRLGRYIGYEIVTSFMNKNDLSLEVMLLQDAQTIFNNAKYKP